MEIYYIYNHHYLPATDSQNKVVGVLSYRSLFDLFMTTREESVLSNIKTTVSLIYKTIKGYKINKCLLNDDFK